MVKIVLRHPHVDLHDGVLCYCSDYRFTEPVNGVEDGQVMFAASGETEEQILDAIKVAAVEHANLQTSDAIPFTLADVVTWEK
jgi:hypothetical protein